MGIFDKPPLRRLKRRDDMPEGLWTKCPDCGAMLHTLELKQHLQTCHHCGYHFLMDSRERIELLADPGSFEETNTGLVSANPLGFSNYREKIAGMREKTGLDDAVVTGRLTIGGQSYRMPRVSQVHRQQPTDGRFVLDNQDRTHICD